MTILRGKEAVAEYAGVTPVFLTRLIKEGKELTLEGNGRRYVIDSTAIDEWKRRKELRTIPLERADFLQAFRFALCINYGGHTRADFGTSRQRSITQAVENWTQGVLAEIALKKFIQRDFGVRLELELRVFGDVVVGQDIVGVTRGGVTNPPRRMVSVKSGKGNGMVLIVPINEVEREGRGSDYYIFVRVLYENDFILRLLRDHPDIADLQDAEHHSLIPEIHNARAEIVGYCHKDELEHRTVPEADIFELRYVKATGLLHNTDADWQQFTNQL